MTERTQDWVLANGLDVIGSDDEKIGEVQDALGEYFVVKKGWLFPTEYYVPSAAIVNVDDRAVYLNVTKDEALNQGWDAVPASVSAGDAGTTVSGREGYVAPPEDLTTTETPPTQQAAPVGTNTDLTADTRDTDTIRVPLSQEELTATRRDVDRGKVRVEKHVVEDEQALDVPVTEEQVHVERRTVDRDVAPGETLFQEGTIDVPVRGEEVDVEKRARVAEELEVSKQAVQRTEHVTGTVRREEAHVTDDTDLADDDTTLGDNEPTRPVR